MLRLSMQCPVVKLLQERCSKAGQGPCTGLVMVIWERHRELSAVHEVASCCRPAMLQ